MNATAGTSLIVLAKVVRLAPFILKAVWAVAPIIFAALHAGLSKELAAVRQDITAIQQGHAALKVQARTLSAIIADKTAMQKQADTETDRSKP